MASLEEGELEDGELLSSDEEPDQGDSKQHKVCNILLAPSILVIVSLPYLVWLPVLFLVTWHLFTCVRAEV